MKKIIGLIAFLSAQIGFGAVNGTVAVSHDLEAAIYEGPGNQGFIAVGALENDDLVTVEASAGDFYRISTPASGYIYKNYVNLGAGSLVEDDLSNQWERVYEPACYVNGVVQDDILTIAPINHSETPNNYISNGFPEHNEVRIKFDHLNGVAGTASGQIHFKDVNGISRLRVSRLANGKLRSFFMNKEGVKVGSGDGNIDIDPMACSSEECAALEVYIRYSPLKIEINGGDFTHRISGDFMNSLDGCDGVNRCGFTGLTYWSGTNGLVIDRFDVLVKAGTWNPSFNNGYLALHELSTKNVGFKFPLSSYSSTSGTSNAAACRAAMGAKSFSDEQYSTEFLVQEVISSGTDKFKVTLKSGADGIGSARKSLKRAADLQKNTVGMHLIWNTGIGSKLWNSSSPFSVCSNGLTPSAIDCRLQRREEYLIALDSFVSGVIENVEQVRGGDQEVVWSINNEFVNGYMCWTDFWSQRISPDLSNYLVTSDPDIRFDLDYLSINHILESSAAYGLKAADRVRNSSTKLMLNNYANSSPYDSRICSNNMNNTLKNGVQYFPFDDVYKTVAFFKSNEIPVDVVGVQLHVRLSDIFNSSPSLDWQEDIAAWKDGLIEGFEIYSELGVEVYITELDVNMSTLPSANLETRYEKQADIFRAVAEACTSVAACTSLNFWGISDLSSDYCKLSENYVANAANYLDLTEQAELSALVSGKTPENGSYIFASSTSTCPKLIQNITSPHLYNGNFEPKPAYWAVRSVLNDAPGDPNDLDGDTVANALDNCVYVSNADQNDGDGDGIGDSCDADWDNDSIPNFIDNCAHIHNLNQSDLNQNGIGDACEVIEFPSSMILSTAAHDGTINRVGTVNTPNPNSNRLSIGAVPTSLIASRSAIIDFLIPHDMVLRIRALTDAKVGLYRQTASGISNFPSFLELDAAFGGFSGNPALQGADHSAAADYTAAFSMPKPTANGSIVANAGAGFVDELWDQIQLKQNEYQLALANTLPLPNVELRLQLRMKSAENAQMGFGTSESAVGEKPELLLSGSYD